MGIPRFLKRLKDAGYGTTKVLGRAKLKPGVGDELKRTSSSGPLTELGEPSMTVLPEPSHSVAIIDGPSFAHWIFRSLQDAEDVTDHAIDPGTTYVQCARRAVQWLRKLEAYGFEIKAIFFDGHLPSSKKPTRINRMEEHRKHVNLYRALHDEIVQVPRRQRALDANVWQSPLVKATRRSLPSLPFLVPAILEALLKSEFNNVVYAVPDEADKFCVAAARKLCLSRTDLDVYIFTNDSDLVVFDSGSEARIVFFNDLVDKAIGDHSELIATVIWPAKINRHSDGGLVQMAYRMSENPYLSYGAVHTSISHSNKLVDDDGFQAFAKTYQLDGQQVDLDWVRDNDSERLILANLDARISELLYQAKALGKDSSTTEFDVYLPVLLDDPRRRSAWQSGVYFRRTAYTLVLLSCGVCCQDIVINEWKASGPNAHPTKLDSDGSQGLNGQLSEYLTYIRNEVETDLGLSMAEQWRYLVMQLVLQDMGDQGVMQPLPEQLIAIVRNEKSYVWEVAHISATYQAVYYSLRMLKQILSYVRAIRGGQFVGGWNDPSTAFFMLTDVLQSLPGIADFFASDGLDAAKGRLKWWALLDTSAGPSTSKVETNVKSRRKKRRSGVKEAKRMQSTEEDGNDEHGEDGVLYGNPFAALVTE